MNTQGILFYFSMQHFARCIRNVLQILYGIACFLLLCGTKQGLYGILEPSLKKII